MRILRLSYYKRLGSRTETFCQLERRADRCQQLKASVDRFFLGAVSVEECMTLLMTALYRIGLSRSEQSIMDTRTIKSYQDLSYLALTLKSVVVSNKEEFRSQERRREGYYGDDRYQV